ncbi:MAG: hypothetical protein PHS46_08355 [Candidatus Omnitrophica bacterium]|nr:hypothetical protein [Candidatus Omnitrophota bacterium]
MRWMIFSILQGKSSITPEEAEQIVRKAPKEELEEGIIEYVMLQAAKNGLA